MPSARKCRRSNTAKACPMPGLCRVCARPMPARSLIWPFSRHTHQPVAGTSSAGPAYASSTQAKSSTITATTAMKGSTVR